MEMISALNMKARKHLNFTALQYMLDAAYENPDISNVYVDNSEEPGVCILQLKHMFFIGGRYSNECMEYMFDEILTSDFKLKHCFILIFCEGHQWEQAIAIQFKDACNKYERSLYHIKPGGIEVIPVDFHIEEIKPELMLSNTNNLDMITDEIMGTGTYESMEDFYLLGIGYAPIINNKVCGFCTSEYPSRDALAIGIEIIKEYQRKGIAKALVKKFLQKASNKKLNIYWECWKNNNPSIKTALSCGFVKVADYPVLFVDFGELQ